jgi:hypothetical protein
LKEFIEKYLLLSYYTTTADESVVLTTMTADDSSVRIRKPECSFAKEAVKSYTQGSILRYVYIVSITYLGVNYSLFPSSGFRALAIRFSAYLEFFLTHPSHLDLNYVVDVGPQMPRWEWSMVPHEAQT